MHPHDITRRFIVGSEDGGIGWDKTYWLIFTDKGEMVVRTIKDYSQDYKTPDVDEIEPKDFDKFTVNGISLRLLVLEKLQKILPAS